MFYNINGNVYPQQPTFSVKENRKLCVTRPLDNSLILTNNRSQPKPGICLLKTMIKTIKRLKKKGLKLNTVSKLKEYLNNICRSVSMQSILF